MQQFEIILKNEKRGYYNKLAFFTLLINLALFGYIFFTSEIKTVRVAMLVSAILLVIALLIDRFPGIIKNNEGFPYRLAGFFIITFGWWNAGFWWLGIVFAGLGILYQVSIRILKVNAGTESISYPSLFLKKIDWKDCLNVILKDGLLTIDLKNNKIIQQAIDEKKTAVKEPEFNDFCQQQLNTAKAGSGAV